ncbi:MAG: hypothetical protein F6J93_03570 [Oscillatoria sp. SIO1A7]|nr:hypothetical protein [Oscillatoria sp. SIO1A7]
MAAALEYFASDRFLKTLDNLESLAEMEDKKLSRLIRALKSVRAQLARDFEHFDVYPSIWVC